MLKVNFIEIGTSNFGALTLTSNIEEVGFAIEPLKFYLDQLPDKINVRKINCAISPNNTTYQDDIYFIKPEVIKDYNLPQYFFGCNKIGDFHELHKQSNLTHLVSKEKVFLIPLASLLIAHNVGEIDFLKIDTEGFDCSILQSFIDYLTTKEKLFWPKKIEFEANFLTNMIEIETTVLLYRSIGYTKTEYTTTFGITDNLKTLVISHPEFDAKKDLYEVTMYLM